MKSEPTAWTTAPYSLLINISTSVSQEQSSPIGTKTTKYNLSPSDWQTLFHKKNSQNSLPSKSNGLLLIRNHGIRRQRMNTIIPYGGR